MTPRTTASTAGTTLTRPALSLAEAQSRYSGGRGYLAACTLGLPSRDTVDAIAADTAAWAGARASAAGYGDVVEDVRSSFAELVGVDCSRVAIGSQVSVMAGMLAASVPDGAEVLCVDGDFTSMVFPFLGQAHRGVTVRHAPLANLAEHISSATWLVAFSLVQSATGAIADADAIVTAARAHGARTFCDTTQATGWLPVDAAQFDATTCHAYKWLCSPRGVAFLTVSPEFQTKLRPSQAGWYAGRDPWASCYGPEMSLADNARQFDVSPAWQAWVGARPAIDMFRRLDIASVRDFTVALGDALCDGLGIARQGQAIVTWPDADGADVARLAAARITASARAGRARVAFHLWNSADDVADVLTALGR
ncbi:aminotransferase class V-fold PLP-dependent enzyme [Leifsonia kafniensis]|uniref:Aminotransferase class V-fold PLP-dependent enzyme n=1 Tax=Leifsonia kafniensis TaxID=475957 RepID=A0ABP7KA81_9MICO